MIGSGSWATALVKILLENRQQTMLWWVRDTAVRDTLATTGCNPRHLPSLTFDPHRLAVSCNLAQVVAAADTLILAVPSAYVDHVMGSLPVEAYTGKRIISAIKGYEPRLGLSISQYAEHQLHVPQSNICVVSGPSHAEEVANQQPTFLSVASSNLLLARETAAMLACDYIHTSVSNEVSTIELCGLTKNVYAIAAGLATGLGYGDNLVAVITTAAAHELQGILPETTLAFRLLSDLLVTCFSHHSRNRALGEAVAKGIAPEDYFHSSGMVAEGYFSARVMHDMRAPRPTPIAEAVYNILHRGADPRQTMDHLIDTAL